MKNHTNVTFVMPDLLNQTASKPTGKKIYTGGPPIVLIFGGKKTPHYMKSALFGDYFSTKTHEMGEIIFQSPLFEVFPISKSPLF